MKNCYHLTLNINPFKDNIVIANYGTARHTKISIDDINPVLISRLEELGLRIGFAELFYTNSFQITGIHTDVALGDLAKLNFQFGGTGSTMKWYSPRSDVVKQPLTTVVNTNYVLYNSSEVEFLEQHFVGFPSLVQAGVPHNIENNSEPRYCLSLVLLNKTNRRLTMSEGYKLLVDRDGFEPS